MRNLRTFGLAVCVGLGLLAGCQSPTTLNQVAPAASRAVAAAPADWSKDQVYLKGDTVAWKGHAWSAGWWTKGEEPGTTGQWGVWKDQGVIAVDTVAPTVPGNPKAANVTDTGADLSWTASTDAVGVTGYKVSLNGAAAVTVTTLTFKATGLKAQTAYTASVSAFDAAGNTSAAATVAFTTTAPVIDKTPPTAPTSLTATNVVATSATINWTAATDNVAVTGYRVSVNGGTAATVTTTKYLAQGLTAKTSYTVTVTAVDAAGNVGPAGTVTFQTPDAGTGTVTTKGTVDFHLHLGVSPAQDKLVLDNDRYTDLILSNYVAGVLCGYMIQSYYPGIQYSRDYLYGSIWGQLLQENLATDLYNPASDLIDSDPGQQPVMGAGQGGPYQINNYAADMMEGSYAPKGHSLINFAAVQKNIGFTYAAAAEQHAKVTPPSFNNKYFSPVLTAYFHYLDFVALAETGKGTGGWVTPWQPAYDQALVNFKTLPNNFLEVILNCSYNQGSYGTLVSGYSKLGATATAATVATVRDYKSVWGKGWYDQYPYQVMYYLDQMYGNLVPASSPTDLVRRDVHVALPMAQLKTIFSKVYQTLAYINAAGQYGLIPAAQAETAFGTGLAQAGVAGTAVLDMANASDRDRFFSVLEHATAALETSLGFKFNTLVQKQL